MEIVCANEGVENQSTSVKTAGRLFGGNTVLARSLLFRINALKQVGKGTDPGAQNL